MRVLDKSLILLMLGEVRRVFVDADGHGYGALSLSCCPNLWVRWLRIAVAANEEPVIQLPEASYR